MLPHPEPLTAADLKPGYVTQLTQHLMIYCPNCNASWNGERDDYAECGIVACDACSHEFELPDLVPFVYVPPPPREVTDQLFEGLCGITTFAKCLRELKPMPGDTGHTVPISYDAP